jgi:hypothetical protein
MAITISLKINWSENMEESWKLGDLKADGSVTPKLFFDKKQRQSQAVE